MTNPASDYCIASFYQFRPLPVGPLPVDSNPADELNTLAREIERHAEERELRGLMILGDEGLNTTVSGSDDAVREFAAYLEDRLVLAPLDLKLSRSPKHPFRVFKVKLRDEIVTLGSKELKPEPGNRATHLSPEDWHRVLTEEDDTIVLDTRNWYESRIGKFDRAIAPPIEEFQEFPEFLKKTELPKDKKILIYCTGGIRCEKAVLEMNRQGYENVFQLEGGILNYLEKFPNQRFTGECFVFDHRVAVDQNLKPTQQYGLCPHCGQPSDQDITCVRCGNEAQICVVCARDAHHLTCSKNCAHHYRLAPTKKGRPQTNVIRKEKLARKTLS